MDLLALYIAEGEHQQQDFKFRIDDAKKIARTLAAFANTDGGRLLIGVKDNGKVVGVNPEEEYQMAKGAGDLFCKPPIEVEAEIIQSKHKLVLIIKISAIKTHLVKALDEEGKWKVYVRRENHTLLANKIYIGVWKETKRNTSMPKVIGEYELDILSLIRELEEVSLSKIYRKTKISKSEIDQILIQFISWGIITMNITPKGTYYSLNTSSILNKSLWTKRP